MGRDCQSQGFLSQGLESESLESQECDIPNVPTIFVPVPSVQGICVPWDDFWTARILGTAWDSSPRDSPGILNFFEKNMICSWKTLNIFSKLILISPKLWKNYACVLEFSKQKKIYCKIFKAYFIYCILYS